MNSAPKAGAPLKAVAPKVVTGKAGSHAAPNTISGCVVMKAVATGQKGPQSTMKAGVLKIQSGLKRPSSMLPSLAQTTKQAKVVKASSFALASTQKVAGP
jgi:hypothetical protein